jgi:hypothetical protein
MRTDVPSLYHGSQALAAKLLKNMVGTRRLELLTSTVSIRHYVARLRPMTAPDTILRITTPSDLRGYAEQPWRNRTI